jgi:peptide/nickel transport system substrate-binding protein
MTRVDDLAPSGAKAKNLASRGVPAKVTGTFARRIAPNGSARHDFSRPSFWPPSQFFTGQRRRLTSICTTAVICFIVSACGARSNTQTAQRQEAIASIRNQPTGFNRHVRNDAATDVLNSLTQSRLVRINKETQDTEPWLAESWTTDESGRRYTLKLRQGLMFSDGHPFSADDVVFSFQAAYATYQGRHSVVGGVVQVGDKPLDVSKIDANTVSVTFPAPYAPGVRLLDNLPILPKHKLEAAVQDGSFLSVWGFSTPASEIVGLGPFIVKEYTAGQRIVFERNPHYWRKDAKGTQLPYLDRLTLEIIPDANAEQLRLEAGQIDMTASEVPPESYASVKRAADAGKVKLFDLGVALDGDSFWFNLRPGQFANDPRGAWLQRDEFRRAISMAVDRRLLADTVYFGAGEPVDGPETSSNKKWYSADLPKVPHDPEGAKKLLASIGVANARFTLITQKGRPRLERGAAVIRDELKKIGVTMDVVPLDPSALFDRILGSKDYEAVYFNPQKTDTDPGTNADFWLSSGGSHFWNPLQPKPATDWERRLDELTTKQVATADESERRRLYAEMLRIFAEHQPVIYFAAPKMYVAVSSRVTLTPAIAQSPVLWSPDTVSVGPR